MFRIRPHRLLFLAALLCGPATPAFAHPFAVVHARFKVEKTRVVAKITVTLEEFYYAFTLSADAENRLAEDDIKASIERYKGYILEHLVLLDIEGRPLEGKVTQAVRVEVPPQAAPENPMAHEVVYSVEYPLATPPPGLTLVQLFGGKDNPLPSLMIVRVQQDGWPVRPAFQLNKGDTQIVSFDWLARPPAEGSSKEPEPEPDDPSRLGIASYGTVYSFFYIEDFEVRHEILIPLMTLESWLYLERKEFALLQVDEQAAAKTRIFEFFAKHNPVAIDGKPVAPELARVDFYDLEFRDFAQRPAARPVPAYAARIGLILRYPAARPPQQVKLKWDLWSRDLRELRTAVLTPETSAPHKLTEANPELTWTNPGRAPAPWVAELPAPQAPAPRTVPAGSALALLALPAAVIALHRRKAGAFAQVLACAVLLALAAGLWPYLRIPVHEPEAPATSAEEARRVFTALHRNVYAAFGQRDEEAAYDTLAKCVDGPLLSELYLQFRQGLEMQEQGGAVSRVKEIKLEESEIAALSGEPVRSGFAIACAWTVEGTVEHWGHIHARTNRYRARFEVEPRGGAWKITAFEVLGLERVNFQTTVRKFP